MKTVNGSTQANTSPTDHLPEKAKAIDRMVAVVRKFFVRDIPLFFTQYIPKAFDHVTSTISMVFRRDQREMIVKAMVHIRAPASEEADTKNACPPPRIAILETGSSRLAQTVKDTEDTFAQEIEKTKDDAAREKESGELRIPALQDGTWRDLASTRQLNDVVASDAINFGDWVDQNMGKDKALTPRQLHSAKVYSENLLKKYSGSDKARITGLRDQLDKAEMLVKDFDTLLVAAEKRLKQHALIDKLADTVDAQLKRVLSVESADQMESKDELLAKFREIYGHTADTSLPLPVIRKLVDSYLEANEIEDLPDPLLSSGITATGDKSDLSPDAYADIDMSDDGIDMSEDENDENDENYQSLGQKFNEQFSATWGQLKSAVQSAFDQPIKYPYSAETDKALSRLLKETSPSVKILEDRKQSELSAEAIRSETRKKLVNESLWDQKTIGQTPAAVAMPAEPVAEPLPLPESEPKSEHGEQSRPTAGKQPSVPVQSIQAPVMGAAAPQTPRRLQPPQLPFFPHVIDMPALITALFDEPRFAPDIASSWDAVGEYFDLLTTVGQVDEEKQAHVLGLAALWSAAKKDQNKLDKLKALQHYKVLDQLLDLEEIQRNFQPKLEA